MPFELFNYNDMIEPMGKATINPTSCPAGQKLVPYQATNAQGQAIERGNTCIADPLYVPPKATPAKGAQCPKVPQTLTGDGYTYKLS